MAPQEIIRDYRLRATNGQRERERETVLRVLVSYRVLSNKGGGGGGEGDTHRGVYFWQKGHSVRLVRVWRTTNCGSAPALRLRIHLKIAKSLYMCIRVCVMFT